MLGVGAPTADTADAAAALRLGALGAAAAAAAAGDGSAKKASADRKLKWGVKLKLDVNKAVVGLAAHPSTTALLVIFDDGTLRGYGMSPNGLQPLWPSVFALPGRVPGNTAASGTCL